jgi:hypothetical protein
MELSGPGVQYVAASSMYKTQYSINTILNFKISSLIIALEKLFIILYYAIVPSVYNLFCIIFITYLLKSGWFLPDEFLYLIYFPLLTYILIILCIIITYWFMYISYSRGFNDKYPIYYNAMVIIFTVSLFILFIMLIFFLFKLCRFTVNKVKNILKKFILKMLGFGNHQPSGWGPHGNPGGGGRSSLTARLVWRQNSTPYYL